MLVHAKAYMLSTGPCILCFATAGHPALLKSSVIFLKIARSDCEIFMI